MGKEYESRLSSLDIEWLHEYLKDRGISNEDASQIIDNAKKIEAKMMPSYFLLNGTNVTENGTLDLEFEPRNEPWVDAKQVSVNVKIEVGLSKYTLVHEIDFSTNCLDSLNFVMTGNAEDFPQQWS